MRRIFPPHTHTKIPDRQSQTIQTLQVCQEPYLFEEHLETDKFFKQVCVEGRDSKFRYENFSGCNAKNRSGKASWTTVEVWRKHCQKQFGESGHVEKELELIHVLKVGLIGTCRRRTVSKDEFWIFGLSSILSICR